ncbi:hypothetical protein MHI48_16465 [Paenibacillus sp. FSL H7-0942]|uniref:fascin domain-containing protein n=1 Tax=Paenibacillus sp. FSL H7-0942 TaxID=2921444 RepID=UPI0032505E43
MKTYSFSQKASTPDLGLYLIKTSKEKYLDAFITPFRPIVVVNDTEQPGSRIEFVPMPWQNENTFCLRSHIKYFVTVDNEDAFLRTSDIVIGTAQTFEIVYHTISGKDKISFYSHGKHKYVRVDNNMLRADVETLDESEHFEFIKIT